MKTLTVPLHFGIQNAFSFSSLSFTFLSHNDAASVRRWMSARLRASDDLATEEGTKRETKTESLFSPRLPPSSFPELNVCLLAKRRGVRVRGMRPSPHFPPRLRFSFLLTTRRSPLSRRVRRVPWVQCLLSSGRERSASGSESGVDDGAAAVRSSTKLSRRVLVNCFNFPGKRVRMRVNECRSP